MKQRLVENIDVMASQQNALRDLLALWDRRDLGSWSVDEVQRLEEIRKLVASQ